MCTPIDQPATRHVWPRLLMLVLLLAGGSLSAREPDPPPEQKSTKGRQGVLTAEQTRRNLESFDYVWTTVRDKYFDPTLGGVDWEKAQAELRPKVAQATSMRSNRGFLQKSRATTGSGWPWRRTILDSDIYRMRALSHEKQAPIPISGKKSRSA